MLRIVVCVKHVPDTQVPLRLNRKATGIEPADILGILNPPDVCAVEQAVRMARALPAEVVLVCLGPQDAARTLRQGLALGAGRALLVTDPAIDMADPHVTAMYLARLVGSLEPRLVLCGARSLDGGTGHVGPAVAEALGLCHVGGVVAVSPAGPEHIVVERKLERGARERVECRLPALLVVDMDVTQADETSLPALLQALVDPIEILDLGSLGLDGRSAAQASLTEITALAVPRPKPRLAQRPDQSLGARERIQVIMGGGMAHRESKLLTGHPSMLAAKAVGLMIAAGLLHAGAQQDSHLRPRR